jgi:ribose transport system substrate-binding protein
MTSHERAMRPRRWRVLLTLAGTAALITTAAACGSSASSSAASAQSSSPSQSAAAAAAAGTQAASGPAALANAQNFLKPYTTAPVTWQGPTSSPPLAKGKHIVFIDIAPTVPTLQTITTATQQLSAQLGWTVTHIDVTTNYTFSQAVQQAISLHPDGILFNFEDVSADPAAFSALAASKIPVITFGLSTDAVNSTNPGITHIVNVNYSLQGEEIAAGAVLLTKGDANLGVFTEANSAEETDHVNGIEDYFKQYGGGSVTAVDYFDPNIMFEPAQVGQAAVAFVEAHPSINQLFVIFDGVAAEVIPALKQAGLSPRVQVISAQGDAYNINLIRTGGGQDADTVWPYTWATYAAFDDFNRIFNHVALPANDGIPVRLFDSSDLYSGTGYWNGDYNFEAKYDALWKIGSGS